MEKPNLISDLKTSQPFTDFVQIVHFGIIIFLTDFLIIRFSVTLIIQAFEIPVHASNHAILEESSTIFNKPSYLSL